MKQTIKKQSTKGVIKSGELAAGTPIFLRVSRALAKKLKLFKLNVSIKLTVFLSSFPFPTSSHYGN
jgi:hypothetical protein